VGDGDLGFRASTEIMLGSAPLCAITAEQNSFTFV